MFFCKDPKILEFSSFFLYLASVLLGCIWPFTVGFLGESGWRFVNNQTARSGQAIASGPARIFLVVDRQQCSGCIISYL